MSKQERGKDRYNTVGLRLKFLVEFNFFNVDGKRLAAGYRQGRIRAASRQRKTQREERKT
ncbi:hypothetical protein FACHB389_15565 [Nostoc calcicola FACHB-389]|nr:hypothetical protein FACHB389_15565 [Nostoc calcicola FACHB-389]